MDYERLVTFSARRRGLRLAAVLAAGAGLTLSACGGGSKQSPAAAVDSSVSQLGNSSSVSIRVSVGITAQQAREISGKNGSSFTADEANALSHGSVFFTAQTGHGEAIDSNQALTDTKDAYDFGLQIGSSTPLEIKYVNQNLYALADVSRLLSDVGQNPGQGAAFQKDLASLNSVVPGISTLGTNQWVEVSHESLSSLGALLKQAAGSNGLDTAQIQSELAQLRTAGLSSLKANSTYSSLGQHDGRSEYSATVDMHGFVTSFGQAVQKDLAGVPLIGTKISSGVSQLEAKVPAGKTAVADVYTSGGKLSEVDVDLNQFAKHKMNFPVPLKVVFTSPPAISAPTTATPLDLSNLPLLLQNLISGHAAPQGSSSGGGAAQ